MHELLLYPPDATEGRAPPALLGFSTNDVSMAYTLQMLFCWTVVLLIVLFCAALACSSAPRCRRSSEHRNQSTMV